MSFRLTLVQATIPALGYLVQHIKKIYFATMVSKLGFETSTELFNSIKPNMSAENCHEGQYMIIKRSIQIVSEDQRPPDSIMEALDKDKKYMDDFQ